MKKRSLKKQLSFIMALIVMVTTMFAIPSVAGVAATPQSLESYTFKLWADPENMLTQEDMDSFNAGTKTTMVGAVGFYRVASSGNYYLFLPSGTDCNNLKFWFSGSASVTADGVTTNLVNGEATSAFSAINEGGITKSYTVTLGTSSYSVTAMKSGDVGTVYIDTESGSMSTVARSSDHSKYEGGTVMVVDADGNVNYDGIMEKIQGRGNGTWSTSNAKNPYNVKLAVSTSLLGMNKAKKWCLLANNNDTSLVKNQLTYDFADYIGVNYQPHCKPVDVYINQQYYGSYQLAEKVEIKSNRINVTDAYENLEIANGTLDETTGLITPADLSSAPAKAYNSSGSSVTISSYSYAAMCAVGNRKYSTNQASSSSSGIGSIIGGGSTGASIDDPDDISGGYLYELEISKRWVDENAGFCAYNRQGWVIKSCDVATKNMVDYSYNLLYALGSAVYNNGYVPNAATTTKCSSGNSNVSTTSNPAPETQYQGKKWSQILDADSAVKYYWTQEYFKNMDSATSSTYFYKDSDLVDSMLYAGPVWDMDNSFGYEIPTSNSSSQRWGHYWVTSDDWYTKYARIYRFYANDSSTGYSSDSEAPLNFYAALATNCTDFWQMAKSYWYTLIRPATEILLGEQTDPSGKLHSIDYYVNTVSKSNTMDNVRLQLNNSQAYDYASMSSSMAQWIQERDTWIDGEIQKVSISNATVSLIPAQKCTGKPIIPEYTLSYNGAVLKEGVDYTVEYSNNINVGNAVITVTGQGLYTGTKLIDFVIDPGTLTGGTVQIPETAYAGDTVFADVKNADGNTINNSITYQWMLGENAIEGATDSSLVIDDSYKGSTISVVVRGDGTNITTAAIESNNCSISTEQKPAGLVKSIASWNYDYSAASEALVTADETGATYYYTATSGQNADTAMLTASVNATSAAKIKWSGNADQYVNTSTTVSPDQTPVMGTSKTDLFSWGEYPYFETTVSTIRYENIYFSAKLGGTKKAPRSWKLQYSIDGEDYTDVDGASYTITANKNMELAFDNVLLPAICNNRPELHIRIVAYENAAINGIDTIIGSLSGDAAINNIVVIGTSTDVVDELFAPTIETTSSTNTPSMLFDNDGVVIADNNGGADVYFSINDGEPALYTGEFNPFDSETAVKGDTVTISAYAQFNDVLSEVSTLDVTFAGVSLNRWCFDYYSENISNGAVFSNGGVYGESGKMTAYTDGVSQYVPYWNTSNEAFLLAPDDGALWTQDSGFYFETSTAGYKNVSFTAKARTTAQGPNSITLQYSLDNQSWTTVEVDTQLSIESPLNQAYLAIELPDECANRTKLYIRVVTTENTTHGDELTAQTALHNNNSKGNLYINNVVIAGEDNGDYKMPYTNKTTDYFGTKSIKYYSPSDVSMQYTVTDSSLNKLASGSYPEGGIVIPQMSGFNATNAGPYTITIWAGDDDDKSLFNTRQYYYKGDTITKFNYSSKNPLEEHLNSDATVATNTEGLEGTLSMYPNGQTAATLTSDNKYGVKVGWDANNIFNATKILDNPDDNGYWIISTSTLGYTDVTLNLEQLSSNKGPRDWGIAYSTDGISYTYAPQSNAHTISNDKITSTVETYNNFKLPAECDNIESLYIKVFINGGETISGKELELMDGGYTGINAIELSGVRLPVSTSVTINTVVLENKTDNTGTMPVDATVMIDGVEYTTQSGTLDVDMTVGNIYTIEATVFGTFVNTVKYTAIENDTLVIPLVAFDLNTDGIINGKDFAKILKLKNTDPERRTAYEPLFRNFADVKQDGFVYAK